MSVINQVLNQLEQRGAHTAPEQTMVRAVPHVKRKSAMPLLIPGLVLAIGFAAWQWMQMRRPVVPAVSAAQHQQIKVAVTPPSTVPVGETSAGEVFLPASQLSFELSSVPLPSSLRELKKNASPNRRGEPAANPASSVHRQASGQGSPKAGAPALVMEPLLTQTAAQSPGSALPLKQVSPTQRADAEFRKAAMLMQQGRIADAIEGCEAALRLDAGHDAARQTLVALLLEGKRGEDAERVLQDGLKVKPDHTGFSMLLARLQVERGAVEQAVATLEKSLPYADAQADYQAFFAALLQRQNRHKEAITHYQIALRLVPGNGVWLMGYGISLQAVQRTDDARDTFSRALDSKTLSPELQAFVQQKLKEL